VDAAEYSGRGGAKDDRLPDEPQKLSFNAGEGYAHMKDFLDCVGSRRTPIASIEAGYQHAVTAMLTNAALKTGRRMKYDAGAEQIVPFDGA
jgi:hypothetical protein